jgi:hypothetical protein
MNFETNLSQKSPKTKLDYVCTICEYKTRNKKDFSKHLMTLKHKKRTNETNETEKIPLPYSCDICSISCNSRTSLWRHKQICNTNQYTQYMHENTITIDNNSTTSAILELIKQNQEFKNLLIEQQNENQSLQKQLINAVKDNGNTYNTTNNNQKFNLNFFLNTTCKDAMNMSEFIENMEVQFEDIENIGKEGYVTGMTNMIMSRIKNLDITQRPLHCTDLKRETIYIKDNDVWKKDDDNTKLHNMIQCIAHKNYAILPAWRDKNPDCLDSDTPKFDFCIKMMTNVLGDAGEGQIKLDNKVIRNIAKHINVDKNTLIHKN